MGDDPKPAAPKFRDAHQAERLATALRENLKRRKARQRTLPPVESAGDEPELKVEPA